jgi:hypothetical protein
MWLLIAAIVLGIVAAVGLLLALFDNAPRGKNRMWWL